MNENIFKYKIGEAVWYWSNRGDCLTQGIIVAYYIDSIDYHNLLNVAIKNEWMDYGDDNWPEIVAFECLFESENEAYKFLRDQAKDWHSADGICMMTREEFIEMYDEKYGQKDRMLEIYDYLRKVEEDLKIKEK